MNADPRRMCWRGEFVRRDASGSIIEARLRLPERWPWARIEVAAPAGGRAWTSPAPVPLDPAPDDEGGWPPATA